MSKCKKYRRPKPNPWHRQLNGNLHFMTVQYVFLLFPIKLSMSWKSSDDNSGIFDFKVGLSTAAENAAPDLVAYRSTARHDNFVFYHPMVAQDSIFYVFVKATNKAQVSDFKVYLFFVSIYKNVCNWLKKMPMKSLEFHTKGLASKRILYV